MRYSKKIVTLIIILNALFTASVLLLFWAKGSEPSTLITAWFAFTTVELWSLAGITKTKVKERKDENED